MAQRPPAGQPGWLHSWLGRVIVAGVTLIPAAAVVLYLAVNGLSPGWYVGYWALAGAWIANAVALRWRSQSVAEAEPRSSALVISEVAELAGMVSATADIALFLWPSLLPRPMLDHFVELALVSLLAANALTGIGHLCLDAARPEGLSMGRGQPMSRRTLLAGLGWVLGSIAGLGAGSYGYFEHDCLAARRSDRSFAGLETSDGVSIYELGGCATPGGAKLLSHAPPPPAETETRGWSRVIAIEDRRTDWSASLGLMALSAEPSVLRPVLTVPAQTTVFFDTQEFSVTMVTSHGPREVELTIDGKTGLRVLATGEAGAILVPPRNPQDCSRQKCARPLSMTVSSNARDRSATFNVHTGLTGEYIDDSDLVVSATVVVPGKAVALRGLVGGSPVALYGRALAVLTSAMDIGNAYVWRRDADRPQDLVQVRPTVVSLDLGGRGGVTPDISFVAPNRLGFHVTTAQRQVNAIGSGLEVGG